MMLEGSFELTIIFFGLTNSLAILQQEQKKEKEHDKVVEINKKVGKKMIYM